MILKVGALFRFVVPAIVSCLLPLLGISEQAFAAVDLALGTTARSYPLSGVAEIEAGYDFLLWGSGVAQSPWYGYLRPRLDGATTGNYNSMGLALDFYPISFLGLRAGAEAVQNDQNYTAYDCATYACLGRFYRNYAQLELSLGAGPFFAQARWRRERWTTSTASTLDFVEPTAGLVLARSGDFETVYRGLLGFKFASSWSLAGVLVYSQSEAYGGTSRFPFLLLRYSKGPFSVGAGGGVFSSALKTESGSALFFLRWEVHPSLALN